MKKRFLIYGLLGWILEVFWTGLGSLLAGDLRLASRTYLWMLPIYGLAVFLEPVYHQIKHSHWFIRGLIWAVLIFIIEYVTGYFLLNVVGVHTWDYTNAALNINGLIRLDYAPVWFITGLMFEQIYRYMLLHKIH